MLNASILFALLCVLGLLLFFSGLPTLSTCALPSIVSDHSGQSFKRPLESVLVNLVTAIYAFAAFWNLGNRQSQESVVVFDLLRILRYHGLGKLLGALLQQL